MVLFDDLRDNEWALVEALFCSEPARSAARPAARRSAIGCQCRAVGVIDGRRLVEAAGPLSLAAHLPPSFRRMASRRHARGNREASVEQRPRGVAARAYRIERGEAARSAEPRSTARRVLDQSRIVARAGQDGLSLLHHTSKPVLPASITFGRCKAELARFVARYISLRLLTAPQRIEA